VLIFDDVATWAGSVEEPRPRFQAVLLPADVAVRAVVVRRRTDVPRAFATGCRLGIGEHGSASFRVRVGHSANAQVGAVRNSGASKTPAPKRRPVSSPGREGRRQELLWVLEAGDVPAVRYHYPGGPRYIVSGRRGELDEVAQPGRVLRRGVLTERHHVILLSEI